MIQIPFLRQRARLPEAFTDVIYVTEHGSIPWEVRRLFRHKGLSCKGIPVAQFQDLRSVSHLIGTVVLDAVDLDLAQNPLLAQTIEALESENIGVILLTHRINRPIKSFALAPVRKSFLVAGSTTTISVEDLWARVSLNLSARKKGQGMVCKPLVSIGTPGGPAKNRLADQLAMAADLIEELQEQMRLAGLVQRDFLPKRLPDTDQIRWASGFQPAEWVSGDIYDVVSLDQDRFGFYIVDAVGHAMPAALLTIFVKHSITLRDKTSPFQILEPAEVLQRLNNTICEERLSGYQFATCCYCLLDTQTMTLTFARAGHPYPILIRPGQEPVQLQARGSLLGVFQTAQYLQSSVQLRPGDKLLLYTDGAEPLIGRPDNQSRFQFEQTFLQLANLPVVEMVDRLMAQAKQAMADQVQVDDITLLALEVL